MSQLDSKMSKDLYELYHQDLISDAVSLDKAGIICSRFSTKGKPGYYTGDRNAKTVIVSLNPGIESNEADRVYKNIILPSNKWHPNQTQRWNGFSDYYDLFMDLSNKAGNYDIGRLDYFDLKPAAFLKDWPNSGINIPKDFPVNKDKDTYFETKAAAMNGKLQLELIPYASQTFSIKKGANYGLLFPYLDIIFDEIISKDREYVIFAAGVFEDIFKAYNQAYGNVIDLSNPVQKTTGPLKNDGRIKGRCKVIRITYNGNCFKAIIAHSYASHALHYALPVMKDYGSFCYSVFKTQ